MPRIAGVNIPEHKPVKISLAQIYGIGRFSALKILKKLNIDSNIRTKELNANQIQKLQKELESLPTEGELKRIVRNNIETLKRIKAYRGLRHALGLPTRGQNTKTNARSVRGKRKTVGAMTKDVRSKMETTTRK